MLIDRARKCSIWSDGGASCEVVEEKKSGGWREEEGLKYYLWARGKVVSVTGALLDH